MSEYKIYLALSDALIEANGGVLPIQIPGVTFTKPNNNRYLEFIQIRNNPENMFLDQTQMFQGQMRALLHWTFNEEGSGPPLVFAERIISKIRKGTQLFKDNVRVDLYSQPVIGSEVIDGTDRFFPITFLYRASELA